MMASVTHQAITPLGHFFLYKAKTCAPKGINRAIYAFKRLARIIY
jgi:hypothetical protein